MRSLDPNINGAFLRHQTPAPVHGKLKKAKTPRDKVFDAFTGGRGYTAKQLRAPSSTSRDSGKAHS